MPEIPEQPTADHIAASIELIFDIIVDSPFVDSASRTNAIASILTPVVRPAIKGPTPLTLFDATTQGTGKSLLSEVVSLITTEREAPMFSAPRDAEEWRKALTSVLREGSTVVVIDNVNYRLDNGDFCKALTETTRVDRILGKSQTINLPVRCAWIATGNNIQLGGDMPRRCSPGLDQKQIKAAIKTWRPNFRVKLHFSSTPAKGAPVEGGCHPQSGSKRDRSRRFRSEARGVGARRRDAETGGLEVRTHQSDPSEGYRERSPDRRR
jgi:hypothetical protein